MCPPSILEIDMISKKLNEQHLQYAFTLISIFLELSRLTFRLISNRGCQCNAVGILYFVESMLTA